MTNDLLVRVERVTKTFPSKGEDVTPLENLDLGVERGDFVALMGPSGSGKTTLLHLIAGIDRATSGHVWVGNVDVGSLSSRKLAHWRNENVGYVFQQYNLVPVLTAWENVELPLLLSGDDRGTRDRKVGVALEAVGLADRAGHLPRQMSGGQQQRVAIARAIVAGPTLLLADEPTGNLDPATSETVFAALMELVRETGLSALIATHNLELAAHMDRILHLDNGTVSFA